MLQGFHWFQEPGKHWKWLSKQVKKLTEKGFTAIWLPPLSKGWGGLRPDGNQQTAGYDAYDFWDPGFYQAHSQDAVTKYGSYEELKSLIRKCHQGTARLDVYADLIFNHKMGGRFEEWVRVQEVELHDKNKPLSDWYDKKLYTRYQFPGRFTRQNDGTGITDNYYKWYWDHFDAFISDGKVYRIKAKNFETPTFRHHGDEPYLMGFDLDTSHSDVVEELLRVGSWLIDDIKIDGFRIDAIKHIRQSFFGPYLQILRHKHQKEIFAVGEYWEDNDRWKLNDFIEKTGNNLSLFDFPLREKFWQAADRGSNFPLPEIFHNTLVELNPLKAVTFVDNHDLQPLRMGKEFRYVEHDWFKPLAYSLMLLRPEGYPCVFFGDYFECDLYGNGIQSRHGWIIDKFLYARKLCLGNIVDQKFDHPNCIGWTSRDKKSMAVVMSNGSEGWKQLYTGIPLTTFQDITGHYDRHINTNENGEAIFFCKGGKVSVWIEL